MAGMEKISEAILDKVRAEAETIIKEAESRAEKEIEQAEKQQVARLEEEKDKMLQEAREEATRIEAQALVKARQGLSKAKAEVIGEIISGVKRETSGMPGDENSLRRLLKEATDALSINGGRVYVSPSDMSAVRELLDKDSELAGKIAEIKEYKCTGGVIVEDSDGRMRIDNTYETRLEMLLPRLLPEIGKEIF